MATENVTVLARPGQIQTDDVTITMHATKMETHTLENEMTDHPVEEGFNITDHNRSLPEKVDMECFISNTPISHQQQTQAVKSGSFTIETTTQEAAGKVGATDGFANGEWTKLKKLRADGALVTVLTTAGKYEQMGISKLILTRTSRDYDAIHFQISFKRIRVVKNKLTRTKVAKDPRATQKTKEGAKTPKPAEVETSTLQKSFDDNAKGKKGADAVMATLKGVPGALH